MQAKVSVILAFFALDDCIKSVCNRAYDLGITLIADSKAEHALSKSQISFFVGIHAIA